MSSHTNEPNKIIFAYGGSINKILLQYIISLTGKVAPKICFLPTAQGDSSTYINFWFELCQGEALQAHVMRVFISSYNTTESFEEKLLSMDAIVVGGGNTLNMMAIWKAQGIDKVLQKAYEKGIVLAGGSAGSLCWFREGSTDSRPKNLSVVKGLDFLPFSHCPHYHAEPMRRPLYHEAILKGELMAGYACDDLAGLVFLNGEVKNVVSQDENNHCYFVSGENGMIHEQPFIAEIIR